MINIGYFSDLHLEGSNIKIDDKGWDIIILAGDISADYNILEQFFAYNFVDTPIIYVLGNHEYERKIMVEVPGKVKELLSQFNNVHVLDNEGVDLFGIRFIGTTLWTNFEGAGLSWKQESKKLCEKNINDFSGFFVNDTNGVRLANGDDVEKLFNKSYKFLEYELKRRETDLLKFVVTHFAPSLGSLSERFMGDIISSYWVNNLEELSGFSDYWVHGHTHNSFSYEKNGTKFLCNPRGNSKTFDLSSNVLFDKGATIKIDGCVKNKKFRL